MAFVSQPTQEGPTSLSSSSSSIASEQAVLMQKSLTSLGHILTPLNEKRAATVLVEDYVFLFYSIYSKVFNKANVWINLYERRCTEPMSSQFLRNLGLKMGIEHLWSYFDVLPSVVTLWFGLLTKGGVTIITWLPHPHHHHVDILTSGGDSMQHVEGKVEVRFVEFKYRDDIHILLVTSWLRKQRRDIRKTRKMARSSSTKN